MAGWARITVTASLALAGISPAWPCSIVQGFAPFEAGVRGGKGWEVSAPWDPIPQPEVHVASVERALSDIPGRCNNYTWVVIEVTIPADSAFSLKDLGFAFRSPKSQDPFLSFPNFPIKSSAVSDDGLTMRFRFGFSPEETTVPIEVFAMNKALQIGRSTSFTLDLTAR